MGKLISFLKQKKLASLLIILALTTLVYSNIFTNQFVWDDPDFYGNWPALYSFRNIPDLLAGELPSQHGGVYRPLRSIYQLLIFQSLGGQVTTLESGAAKNIFGYHLISLLIHLAGVIAIYFLVELLTAKRLLAFSSALIFGLHPIHVEAITYFTTSVDIIGAVLFLWSVYFYYQSQKTEKTKLWFYLLSIILAYLAFFSYEITLILPLALILIDYYRENFSWRELIKKIKFYLPYFVGVIAWIGLRIYYDVGVRAFSSTASTTLSSRLLTESKAIIKYIYLLFFPLALNVYHQINFSQTLAEPRVFLAIIGIIILLAAGLMLAKKQKLLSFGIFWFFLALAPVANVFPTGIVMAEKYTYLASASAALILAWLIFWLLQKEQKTAKIFGLALILAVAIFYGSLTYARNFDWKSNETLWLKTLTQRPDYGRVYNNLGFVYYQQKRYSEALDYLEQAQEKEPNLAITYQNLGNVYDELGDFDQAITNYQKVIKLYPHYAEGYNNLGITYRKIGELDKALENYEKAIEVDPNYFISYSNAGVIYLIKGDRDQAQEFFEEALALNPNFGQAWHGLAVIYAGKSEFEKAISYYQKSMAASPQIIDNYNHLAFIYEKQGKISEATAVLEKGISANPDDLELKTNLAIVLANHQKFQEAINELQNILKINPDYEPAKKVLGQIEEAIKN